MGSQESEVEGMLRHPLAYLIKPTDSRTFWKDHWEKKPLLCPGATNRQALKGVMSWESFCTVLDERKEAHLTLRMPEDAQVSKYEAGVRSTLGLDGDEEDEQILEREVAEELYMKQGGTIQVHQPQRFDNTVWRLCGALERELGCLVGCNAYLTPPGTQGLAPHHDDVELWVCQTSGDVLYLPRGFVHEAAAQHHASSHVTISTYQMHSYIDLAQRVMSLSRQAPPGELTVPYALRQGLPLHFIKEQLQLPCTQPKRSSQAAQAQLADGLRRFADLVEADGTYTQAAAGSMAREFMLERLPPVPEDVPMSGPIPTLESHICCRLQGAFQLVSFTEDDEDSDDMNLRDAEGSESDSGTDYSKHNAVESTHEGIVQTRSRVVLLSSLWNSRERHMMPRHSEGDDTLAFATPEESEGEDAEPPYELVPLDEANAPMELQGGETNVKGSNSLVLPESCAVATQALLNCNNGVVMTVEQLPGLKAEDQTELAIMLHAFGALRTVSLDHSEGKGGTAGSKRANASAEASQVKRTRL